MMRRTASVSVRRCRPARTWGCIILLAGLLIGACRTTRPDGAGSGAPDYKILAYVRGRADISRIDAAKLTHINYAFAQVSPEGEVVFRHEEAPAHLAQLQALKAKNPRLKILVSVGGWGADHFSDAALTQAAREKFARSAVACVRRYALDGIDLDWEYPGQPGPGIMYRPEDRQNFTLLLKALREHLEALSDERGRTGADRYLLTIASSGSEAYFEHTEMDRLHAYLDFINVMTYDFFGSWTEVTGHHTGLYRSSYSDDATRTSQAAVERHLEAGIPPHKLVLGAAFYGRGWTGVAPHNNGLSQPYERYAADYSYSTLARDYIDTRGFRRHWDDAAKAPYLWNPDSTTVISYDDEESLQHKAAFVKAHGLGGIMYWEHSHDPDEVLLNALYNSLR